MRDERNHLFTLLFYPGFRRLAVVELRQVVYGLKDRKDINSKTRNPEPGARNPEPGTRNPEPEIMTK